MSCSFWVVRLSRRLLACHEEGKRENRWTLRHSNSGSFTRVFWRMRKTGIRVSSWANWAKLLHVTPHFAHQLFEDRKIERERFIAIQDELLVVPLVKYIFGPGLKVLSTISKRAHQVARFH